MTLKKLYEEVMNTSKEKKPDIDFSEHSNDLALNTVQFNVTLQTEKINTADLLIAFFNPHKYWRPLYP